MAKLLFAMEEMDTELDGMEMEVSPEEGEVADVQTELETEIADVAGDETAISNADEAGEQMEEVGDLLEGSEGLDEVAAEATRIAVEAICARVGADPKKMGMYHLYATENFASTSSRKANTQIALEGVKEFLKELWQKIKTAMDTLWKKVTAFWDKHLSSLGRVKKALESMNTKISSMGKTMKGDGMIEKAPSGLVSAFAGTESINKATVSKYIKSHADVAGEFSRVVNDTSKASVNSKFDQDEVREFGSNAAPLIGGVWFKYTFENEEGKITTTVETENVENTETELQLIVAGKEELKSLVKETLDVIKATVKSKTELDKANKEYTKAMSAVLQQINAGAQTDDAKTTRQALVGLRSMNSKLATFSTKLVGLDVKLAKSVLQYVSICIKQYK